MREEQPLDRTVIQKMKLLVLGEERKAIARGNLSSSELVKKYIKWLKENVHVD